MLEFASLGSGSKGNGTVIRTGKTTVLVDCGFTLSHTVRQLSQLDCDPASIDAIIVTHEHGDHSGGVGKLSRKFKIPVYMTCGTWHGCRDTGFDSVKYLNPHRSFSLDDLEISPFPVPHDAREPCQFSFSDGTRRLGLLTDVGSITPCIVESLTGVDALMLECNYDKDMLLAGSYPYRLKQRVIGQFGHLDNLQAKEFLKKIDCSNLQFLIGMHLSENNNHVDFARNSLCEGMGCDDDRIMLANQENGFIWKNLK